MLHKKSHSSLNTTLEGQQHLLGRGCSARRVMLNKTIGTLRLDGIVWWVGASSTKTSYVIDELGPSGAIASFSRR